MAALLSGMNLAPYQVEALKQIAAMPSPIRLACVRLKVSSFYVPSPKGGLTTMVTFKRASARTRAPYQALAWPRMKVSSFYRTRKRPSWVPTGHKSMLAFHFAGHKSRYGDERIPLVGQWWKLPAHAGRLRCCRFGLHASRHPEDAHNYKNAGDDLCLVEVRYVKDWRRDKFVARWRKVLARMPGSRFEEIAHKATFDCRDRGHYRRLLKARVLAEFRKARARHTGKR